MSKFPYDEAKRKIDFQNKLLDAAFVSATSGSLKKRDPKQLADCLRQGYAITKRRHLVALAELILPTKKKVGRPKGTSMSTRAEAVARIVGMVRQREKDWQKMNPSRPFYGVRKKAIAAVFQILNQDDGDDSFSFPQEITPDEVKAALDRPKTSRKKRN